MKTSTTIITLLLLWQTAFSQYSELHHYVPYIKAKDPQLGIEETGAGLLVGYERQRVYIATAYHVVAGMTEINVRFRGDSTTVYPATLVNHDRELDLATLAIAANLQADALDPIILKMEEDFKKGDPVFSIGHPFGEGWQLNDRNTLLERQANLSPRLAAITPEAIVPGCSGGPVFDLKEQLIGLVLRENEINAPCVRAYTIKQKLKDWRIPSNLILSNEEWWAALSPAWRSIFDDMVRISIRRRANPASQFPSPEFFLELFASTKFKCNKCELDDLKPLSRLVKVQELIAKQNQINDLSPLTKLSELKYLDLRYNDIASLEPLTNSYDLIEVNVMGNRAIQSLSPLKNLVNLQKANVSRTGITSIAPLLLLNDLEDVSIFLTDVPAREQKQFKKQLPRARLRYRSRREGLSHLIYLIAHPADKKERAAIALEKEEPSPARPTFITPVYQPAPVYGTGAPSSENRMGLSGASQRETEGPAGAIAVAPTAYSAPVEPAAIPPATYPATAETASASEQPMPMQQPAVVKPEREAPQEQAAVQPPQGQAPPEQDAATVQRNKEETDRQYPITSGVAAPPTGSASHQGARAEQPEREPSKEKIIAQAPSPPAQQPKKELPIQKETAAATPPPNEPSAAEAHEMELKNLLLSRQFSEVEQKASKYLGDDPENNLYRVYIVLGRLYQGRYESARELWFFFQKKSLPNGENFNAKVLAEIQALEKQGITSPVVKKFRALIMQ